VLHLIETLGSGGAERLLHTNLKHFDTNRVASEVVTVFSNGDYWKKPIEELGVRVSSLECRGYKDILAGVRRLRKYIAENRIDLIHTHLFAANVIGRIAGRLSGVPVISSIHNPEYEPEAYEGASSAIRRKIGIARLVDKLTARFGCTRMIAVSNYVKETTITRLGYPLSKIDVIYNPVHLSEADEWEGRKAVRESLGLPDSAVFLLHVGRLSPQKGFIDAVRAMQRIIAEMPHAHLVSVGSQTDADYKSKVMNEIDSLGLATSVYLAGERRDVTRLLRSCDIFLFPSHFEGLGIALAEAMAVGCACVASDIRPLTEFVTNEVNGVLVKPKKSELLADAVTGLLRDSAKRDPLGLAARETALDLFQPNHAAEKLVNIYFDTVKADG